MVWKETFFYKLQLWHPSGPTNCDLVPSTPIDSLVPGTGFEIWVLRLFLSHKSVLGIMIRNRPRRFGLKRLKKNSFKQAIHSNTIVCWMLLCEDYLRHDSCLRTIYSLLTTITWSMEDIHSSVPPYRPHGTLKNNFQLSAKGWRRKVPVQSQVAIVRTIQAVMNNRTFREVRNRVLVKCMGSMSRKKR